MSVIKKAFSLVEMTIVVWLVFFFFTVWYDTFTKNKLKMNYEECYYNMLTFLNEAITYSITNFTQWASWTGWSYEVPPLWYWVAISSWTRWYINLKLFYNNFDDPNYISFNPSDDKLIKEWESNRWAIFIEWVIWSWSSACSTWTCDYLASDTFTWTIVFKNNGEVAMSWWDGDLLIKNLTINFHMTYLDSIIDQRRLRFDRIEKIPRLEKYIKWTTNKWLPAT